MIKKLYWDAYTSRERITALEEIKHSVLGSHGYIVNFNMFSDLAISLSIEIAEKHILELHNELQKVMTISEFDSTRLNQHSENDWMILMNITFSGGTGKLKHEKPMVDG